MDIFLSIGSCIKLSELICLLGLITLVSDLNAKIDLCLKNSANYTELGSTILWRQRSEQRFNSAELHKEPQISEVNFAKDKNKVLHFEKKT